jgi:ABC-type microcin C transport system duplicated ATPase subunit YejF
MIFQEPMSALNPVLHVGEQVTEALRVHERASGGPRRRAALALLERVGIADAAPAHAAVSRTSCRAACASGS